MVTKIYLTWSTKGPSSWGDLDNSLIVDMGSNGKVKKIRFVRDEPVKEGIAVGIIITGPGMKQGD